MAADWDFLDELVNDLYFTSEDLRISDTDTIKLLEKEIDTLQNIITSAVVGVHSPLFVSFTDSAKASHIALEKELKLTKFRQSYLITTPIELNSASETKTCELSNSIHWTTRLHNELHGTNSILTD